MRRLRKLLSWKVRLILWGVFFLGVGGFLGLALVMPGHSYRGPLPPLDEPGRQLAQDLEGHVRILSALIGPRHGHTFRAGREDTAELEEAADYIQAEFGRGGYAVERQVYQVEGRAFSNLEAPLPGGREIVVVGAHYDSIPPTPGADDNASGVAILLELARRMRDVKVTRTVRFVAFTNEEPYYFQTETMGSLVYARRCRERDEPVVAMLSLETLGYYKDEPGSQKYPFPLGLAYPDTGNFVAFVGDLSSRGLVHQCLGRFRNSTQFPSEGACLPSRLPGVGWSDHWSFWQAGYPAVMATDTAPFRNPNYHQESDLPDTLDSQRMARVAIGLEQVLKELAAGGN